MFRVIREFNPTWVLGENVANFSRMALDETLFDLEDHGYETITFNLPACGVDAWHKRERVFIVATNSRHLSGSTEQIVQSEVSEEPVTSSTGHLCSGSPTTPSALNGHNCGTFQEWGGAWNKLRGSPLASGKVNPVWEEWLMGFPKDWTNLDDKAVATLSETQSSRSKSTRSSKRLQTAKEGSE